MGKRIDYNKGQMVGELEYMAEAYGHVQPNGRRVRIAWFRCPECGGGFTCWVHDAKRGKPKSCGCLTLKLIAAAGKTHGLSKCKVYKIYNDMLSRCFNKNTACYKDYGLRGITVCEEWKNSFIAFYNYVTNLPHYGEVGRSIDREDNEGNYEPGNVRWANPYEQNVNKRILRKSRSGYTGVYYTGGAWVSKIHTPNGLVYLGRFKSALKGAEIRDGYIIDNNLMEHKLQTEKYRHSYNESLS